MLEIDEFYNNGFGWICKRCERESKKTAAVQDQETKMPRVWREGEAESKQIELAAPLAKWLDFARGQLICPRCKITEFVNKS